MEGPSITSFAGVMETLSAIQSAPGTDLRSVAGELFAVSELLASTAKLRVALSDSSREAAAKRELAEQLLRGRVGDDALRVVQAAASLRWGRDADLATALESAGVDTVLAAAQQDGTLDSVERELVDVSHTLTSDREVVRALSEPRADKQSKAQLVTGLLSGKVSPDAVWLAQRPVLNPRGQDYATVIGRILDVAARRRQAKTAKVTTRVTLDDRQVARLAAGLATLYKHDVFVDQVVDPSLLGGLRIQIGDEVIDATIDRRLAEAGRGLSA